MKDPVFRKIGKEYEYRLNKLYTHPLLGHLLDSGEIDFAILDVLEQLHRVCIRGRVLNPNQSEVSREIVQSHMFQALLDLNIIHKSKYYDMLHIEHGFYLKHVLGSFIERKKQEMVFRDKLKYWLFRKAGKGFSLGTKWGGMPALPFLIEMRGQWHWSKHADNNEFADLYFKVGPAE